MDYLSHSLPYGAPSASLGVVSWHGWFSERKTGSLPLFPVPSNLYRRNKLNRFVKISRLILMLLFLSGSSESSLAIPLANGDEAPANREERTFCFTRTEAEQIALDLELKDLYESKYEEAEKAREQTAIIAENLARDLQKEKTKSLQLRVLLYGETALIIIGLGYLSLHGGVK